MPTGDDLLVWTLAAVGVVALLALGGATINVRHGGTSGRVTMRGIIRALLGHRRTDRKTGEDDS